MRTELQLSAGAPRGWWKGLALHARDALLFGLCYFVFDWASYIYPLGPFNITPWNPPPALSIVWMLLGGLRYAPVVFIAILAGEILIRHTPAGPAYAVLSSLVLTAGYTGIAALLRSRFHYDSQRIDTNQLWIFIGITALGIAATALLYVGVLWPTGILESSTLPAAVFRFWLGDTVGVLVTAPLLLVAASPDAVRRLARTWRRPMTVLQFALLILTVVVIFNMGEPQSIFYLLFLPVIWIALRNGLAGAAVASAIVQAGVVIYSSHSLLRTATVFDLQALVSASTLTGLFLGVLQEERRRALEKIKNTLRLAAAGEMAGAIAHEINQPLAAMRNYGNACRLMLERGGDLTDALRLDAVIGKMLDELRRTSDIVGRLRDFFLSGTTRLAPVTVDSLLARARAIGEGFNQSGAVAFEVESTLGHLQLYADQVQIELILRNLIDNAFEAVAALPPGSRRVTVSTPTAGTDGWIVFRVTDNGPGVPTTLRARLFEPFTSRKASGMGLGLAFSRAIAEAHGGTLHMNDRPYGEFELTLPLETAK